MFRKLEKYEIEIIQDDTCDICHAHRVEYFWKSGEVYICKKCKNKLERFYC